MIADEIPEDVRMLLRNHVTSFEQLEVLMLLHKYPHQDWDGGAVGKHVGIATELASTALEGLESSRLIRRASNASPVTFHYAYAQDEMSRAVDALAAAYKERRAVIMSIMSVNAIERIRSGTVRAFADSFVLGRKNRDG